MRERVEHIREETQLCKQLRLCFFSAALYPCGQGRGEHTNQHVGQIGLLALVWFVFVFWLSFRSPIYWGLGKKVGYDFTHRAAFGEE